mgnify:FL=1
MTPQEFLATEPTAYSDWFGSGDSHTDYREAVAEYGEPQEVIHDEFMLCLIYTDKIVVTGYDGNEYTHSFTFPRSGS